MSAIDRITHYVAMRAAKPMRGMADEIHGIHAGEEWEARLFLSDIKEIASAIRAQSKRIADLEAWGQKQALDIANLGPLAARTVIAESRLAKLEAALKIAREYLEDAQDVNWEGTGPNDQMKFLQEINEAMEKR